MKPKKIVAIILLSILVAVLVGIMIMAQGFISSFSFYVANENKDAEFSPVTRYECEGENIDGVYISFVDEHVTFYESENNSFLIEAQNSDGEKCEFYCEENENALHVQSAAMHEDLSEAMQREYEDVTVKIYIPQNYKKDIYIGSVSGNVEGNLAGSFSSVLIDTVSADCNLDINSAVNMDVDGVSGNCNLTVGSVKDMDFENVSGDYTFDIGNVPGEIDINTESGKGVIYLPKNATVKCENNSVSGELKSEFEASVNGECNIEFDSAAGNLDIKKK